MNVHANGFFKPARRKSSSKSIGLLSAVMAVNADRAMRVAAPPKFNPNAFAALKAVKVSNSIH